MRAPLPLPTFFEPENAARYGYCPNSAALFEAAQRARQEHRIGAGEPGQSVHLLLIDVQRDFCFPEGTLYVAGRSGSGAVDDSRRLAVLLKENIELDKPLHPRLPYCAGEVVWAVRQEMARTVEDVLARRTRALLLDTRASVEIAPAVAALIAKELGCDTQWEKEQIFAFRTLASRYLLERETA